MKENIYQKSFKDFSSALKFIFFLIIDILLLITIFINRNIDFANNKIPIDYRIILIKVNIHPLI